ncbi:neurotensin/neuromedin N isoform X2 [Antennarius striatus]|uniref:neurotensin/neuromedin N isoform X2 n=1 Tax=Antennarius striatus TaxID=241820 RepID=UPI0035ADCB2F
MQPQLACLLLLCLTCGGLCTDVSEGQRALEDHLLGSILSPQIRQNRHSAPYWRMSLAGLCGMMRSLREEEEEDEELNTLLHICHALHSRQERLLQDSLEHLESSDSPPKRKSPYILRRQASQSPKSRRPYILRRRGAY